MLFEIFHTTIYSYDRPVFFEPHTFRLRPRQDAALKLMDFHLAIEPAPAGLTEALDVDGNAVTQAWFSGTSDRLAIKAVSRTEAGARNPFDFIFPDAACQKLPMRYSPSAAATLSPYLARANVSAKVDRWVKSITHSAGGGTVPFLVALCREIRDRSLYTIREEGDAKPAAQTFNDQRGSCRDLAVLFMDACRAQGIAARFVSGYHDSRMYEGQRYMHAWGEVYLPGGGWRAFDPTLGLAVTDGHIAVAAAADPKDAAPVTGSFRGDAAERSLRADIEIARSA
ncbi:MAG TPA: transglutaminase family protein [Candidatus Binatia bacterium]|nr:transglutaminase family protein [Candidatus Binatia bacterium]